LIDRPEAFDRLDRYTLQAFVQPTLPGKGRQAIAATWSADRKQGFCLMLDVHGALTLELEGARVTTGRPLARERWYYVAAAVDAAIGQWDFSREIPTDRLLDASASQLHGRTVNAPKRAVAGANWDGTAMDWRQSPRQYGAIHFHQDDLYDCGWRVSHEWTLPA